MKNFLKSVLVIAGLLIGTAAFAKPVICSPGYQDATCVTPISRAAAAAPACSTAAGWTTVSPAAWQGSHWGQPTCNYQAPQTCPAGYTQTSASVWTGSSWTAPACSPPTPPPPPPNEGQACLNAFNTWTGYNNYFSHYILNNPGNLGGPLTGPYSGNGLDQYNAQVQAYFSNGNSYLGLVMVSGSQPTSPNDMFEVGDYFCWVQPQTANVIGLGQAAYCGTNGGSASCGGGGYGN